MLIGLNTIATIVTTVTVWRIVGRLNKKSVTLSRQGTLPNLSDDPKETCKDLDKVKVEVFIKEGKDAVIKGKLEGIIESNLNANLHPLKNHILPFKMTTLSNILGVLPIL